MKILLGVLLLAFLPMTAQAEQPVAIGWTLLDQFDKGYTADNQLQVVLIARDMTGSKLVKAALQGTSADFLESRHAVFVADISDMPAPISALFAVPAMRDYHYRVLLDRSARVASLFPGPAETITWLQLQKGKLLDTRYFTSAESLRQALQALP